VETLIYIIFVREINLLKKNLWKRHEPRFEFPVFKNIKTKFSFSVKSDYKSISKIGVLFSIYGVLKLNHGKGFIKIFGELIQLFLELISLVFSRNRENIKFKFIILSRNGKFLGEKKISTSYPPGSNLDIGISELISEMNLPNDDYMIIVVTNKGRLDENRSSPGSYSMTYYNEKIYTTYRTGGFARVLNDQKIKRHFGFRGINPKIIVTKDTTSSILLINHSSDTLYEKSVFPKAQLLRKDGKIREADFGEIPPFGGVERSMEELFGEDVQEFLLPSNGLGTTIITCPGVSLGSIHIKRTRDLSSMSIEHSRPTHTIMIHGTTDRVPDSKIGMLKLGLDIIKNKKY
jgi:hypothetical protein